MNLEKTLYPGVGEFCTPKLIQKTVPGDYVKGLNANFISHAYSSAID